VESEQGGSLASGFTLTLFLRLLSVTILSVVPLFMLDSLRISETEIGFYISLLWVGNAAGAAIAVWLVKRRFVSSVSGFSLLFLSLAGFAISEHYSLAFASFVGLAGLGMGMAQPFLAPLMHLASKPSRPYLGIGLYSIALSIGLICGPFVAAISISIGGYVLLFLTLAMVSLLAVGELVWSRLRGSARAIESQSFSILGLSKALRTKGFSNAFVLNFFFSMLLPIFLSYGGVLGEIGFALSSQNILLIFTGVFAISALIRVYNAKSAHNLESKLIFAASFLVGSFLLIGISGISRSTEVFLIGMLLFSVPHAMIPPIANYHALKSVNSEYMIGANSAFQISSGTAEFVAPIIMAFLVPLYGLSRSFIIMSPVAVVCLVWALLPRRST
jgi:MFS family permease